MSLEAPKPRDVLAAEILEDARRKSERLLAGARREAEGMLAQARSRGEQERRELVETARVDAARARERIVASVPVQRIRLHARRVEEQLASVRTQAEGRLREDGGAAVRETLVRLAAQAIEGMTGPRFVLHLAAEDQAIFGDELAAEIRRRCGRPEAVLEAAAEPAPIRGGIIVSDPESRQAWDNSFEARMRRWWPELRRELAAETALMQPLPAVVEEAS